MSTTRSRLQPNKEEVAAKVMDGEAILINLSNGIYYSMDKVGAAVWEMIESNYDLEEIISAITGRYQVSTAQAREDVAQLLKQLLDEHLALETDGECLAHEKLHENLEHKAPYESPQLNIYRDMGDLLALDPPTPGLEVTPWRDSGEENKE